MTRRTQGVHGKDYVVHKVSTSDPLRTRCGRVAAEVNVDADGRETGEGVCKHCVSIRIEDLQVGYRVVAKTDRGPVEGVIDSFRRDKETRRNWVVLRVDGIPESVSGVAGSEAWETVGFRPHDIVEIVSAVETWRVGRCPCCRKRTEIVLGPLLNEVPRGGWSNLLSEAQAEGFARAGTCPWCGRATTTVARTLLQQFQPTLERVQREGLF